MIYKIACNNGVKIIRPRVYVVFVSAATLAIA
jgi:hypothetical protein